MREKRNCLSVVVPYKVACEEYNSSTREKLIGLMRLLYQVFFFPSPTDGQQMTALSSMVDLEEFVLTDQSLVTHAIIALGSGLAVEDLLPCGKHSNRYQRSSYMAFCVAVEMMRRGKSTMPGAVP